MTRTRPKPRALELFLCVGLSAALALPTLFMPGEARAGAPEETTAPVIVVTPAPAPAPPAPPPAPAYQPSTVTGAPAPMIIDPRIASLKQRRNSGLGMTISGFTMFGTTYLISALIGTISIDYANDVGGSGVYGQRMLIPVAGPFMAIPRTETATGGMFTGLLGVVQIGGLVLGMTGAVRFGRANRELRLSADTGGLKLQF